MNADNLKIFDKLKDSVGKHASKKMYGNKSVDCYW